jgi:hypothetical protein
VFAAKSAVVASDIYTMTVADWDQQSIHRLVAQLKSMVDDMWLYANEAAASP